MLDGDQVVRPSHRFFGLDQSIQIENADDPHRQSDFDRVTGDFFKTANSQYLAKAANHTEIGLDVKISSDLGTDPESGRAQDRGACDGRDANP